ncbi:putative IQ and AAA domain-containing protein 1 [Hypsibius exemplaris]|uniref:IQ and AAA domain-containing protein 1 n=1 Tax=Hypsibius exemplaris TaxID=2072580 RepID=A0A1W0X1I7_HYPEX|nr:putative IQ and AAA domain-containing protein 1 [Hypsibius exemplaris]
MVNLEQSDFQYLYSYAMEMGYSMMDLQVAVPRYIFRDRYENLQERDALLQKYVEKRENLKVKKRAARAAEHSAVPAAEMGLKLERCRQAWVTVADLIKARKETFRHKESHRRFQNSAYGAPQIAAARRIQAFWRATKTRKLAQLMRRKELQVLRVIGPDELHTLAHEKTMDGIAEERRVLARKNEEQFQAQKVAIKEQLRETETPGIVNHIESQIRQWFLEYRDATGKFPDYPAAEAGGSASLFEHRNPQEIAAELDKLRIEREAAEAEERLPKEGKGNDKKGKGKDKKEKNGGKDDKKKKKPKDAKGKGKGKKKDGEDEGWKPVQPLSAFLSSMNESIVVFHDFWEQREDKNNLNQEFDVDMVKAEKRKELKEEVRVDVDLSMRKELDYLKLAIDGQEPKKGKKTKGKGKKKDKKGRKEKDLTPNRTPESIFEELAMNNVLQIYTRVRINDYWGSARIIGEQLREANYDFDLPLMPQAEEIRNIITHYCILPVASAEVRAKVPPVKSVLLAGPPHNGKHRLADMICTELGASRFVLNLNHIKTIYRGRSGIIMLLHLIIKLGRIFQPSVIVIESAEYLFSKRAPKTFKSEFKVIKKELQKYMKKMPPEDRLLILGITSSPVECNPKVASKLFNKIIPVPLPDYHARIIILNKALERETNLNFLGRDPFLLPTVAKISEYASSTQLIEMAKTAVRMAQPVSKGAGDHEVTFDPKLINLECFVALSSELKLFSGKPLDQFEAWYAKMPMSKKRRLLLEDKLGLNDPPDKKKKSGAKKK